MRFFCEQQEFLKGLTIAQKAISSQNTLPVLGNVLLNAEGQKLHLSGTNLEVSIQVSIPADIKNEGKITIPAKIITNWVNYLKNEEIEVRIKENETLFLKTNEAKTSIKGISAEEFPILTKIDKEYEFQVTAKDLKKAINEVVFASAQSSIRPVLSGILLTNKGLYLKMVATDSYRLSEKSIKLKNQLNNEIYCIVPSKTMVELERILSMEKEIEEVKVIISQNQILFQIGNIEITSRLIDGKFPEYEQIIPKKPKTIVSLKKNDFVLAVKRVGIFAKENNNNMKLSFENDKLIITTEATEIGTEEAEITIKSTGENTQSSLNGQYLLDICSVIQEEEMEIKITEKLLPIIIHGKDQKDFVHIIMPLKL